MTRPPVQWCSVMGGRSPLTGKKVGIRHRWGGGEWGKGRCDFCGHYLDEVLVKPKPVAASELPLSAVIDRCVDAAEPAAEKELPHD